MGRLRKLRRYILLLTLTLPLSTYGADAPHYFTYQGRLLNSTGTGPLTSVVDLKFQIYDPTSTCLLYEELISSIDLSLSSGIFSVKVGSTVGTSKRTISDPGLAMSVVFANTSSQIRSDDSGTTNTCPGGYTPANGDVRNLRVTIIDGGVPTVLTPDQLIASQPYAMVAQTLQGLTPNGFIRANGAVDLTQANAELLVSTNDASSLHHHDSLYVKAGGTSSVNMGSGGFYTSGQIGVGTSSPDADIEIERTNPRFRMDAASGGGGTSQLQFYSGAVERARIESSEASSELKFYTGSVAALAIDGNQNATFTSNIILKGFLDLGEYTNAQETAYLINTYLGACLTDCMGTLWFNSSLGKLRYWDGATVKNLGDISGSHTAGGVAYSDGTDLLVTGAGTAGHVLVSDGTGAPTWSNVIGSISLSAQNTLGLGQYTAAEESAAILTMDTSHTGKVWYNTDLSQLRYWTGTQVQGLGVAGGSLSSLNSETGSVQAFGIPGTTGTDPNWVSSSNVHTLNIPMANTASVNAGLISKTEYDTFNSKQAGDQQLTDIAAINPASPGLVGTDGTNLVMRSPADARGDLGLGTMAQATATDYLLRNGSLSMTGALDLDGNLISNVATPVGVADATNKAYVDAAIGAISTTSEGAYLAITDNLSDLDDVATARTNLGLSAMATATPTDYLLRNGSLSMTGALDLDGNLISNVAPPVGVGDATNKAYVDGKITNLGLGSMAQESASDYLLRNGTLAMTGAFKVTSGSQSAPSVTFAGDLDTGMFSPSANVVAVATGGSRRVTIDDNGNVGIGTGAPVIALDVNGQMYLRGDRMYFSYDGATNTNNDFINFTDTNGLISGSKGMLSLHADADRDTATWEAANVGIAAGPSFFNGNVGIGTTAPARQLHVNGPIRVTASALPGNPATGDIAVDSGDGNKLKYYNGSGWQEAGGGSGGGRTSCPAGFSLVGTSGSTEAYCISTNEETAATWLNAVTNCSNKTPAARLCSASEWVHACVKAGTYGVSNMTGNWEWVADLGSITGQVMGNSGCGSFDYGSVSISSGSRCCFR